VQSVPNTIKVVSLNPAQNVEQQLKEIKRKNLYMSGLLFRRPKYTDKAPRQFSFKGVYIINVLLSYRNELGT
jgi:hypothetical protein